MKTSLYWAWFAACELAAFLFFWVPPWIWTFGHWHEPLPLGLSFIVVMCLFEAWSPYAMFLSIKPVGTRTHVDWWDLPINALFGNPEDGVSGLDALGPSWQGFYNPTGSRWGAICWNCRNWMAGFNYITWRWASVPPIIFKDYTLFGKQRQLKLGWQQLPVSDGWRTSKVRMVCSA